MGAVPAAPLTPEVAALEATATPPPAGVGAVLGTAPGAAGLSSHRPQSVSTTRVRGYHRQEVAFLFFFFMRRTPRRVEADPSGNGLSHHAGAATTSFCPTQARYGRRHVPGARAVAGLRS